MQVAAVDRELRVLIAGEPAGRLPVDELAVAVEEGRLAGRDADGGQLSFEAQPGEDLRRVRQDVDADADGPQLRGSLVDFAVDAGVVQLKGERQPADARPDDRELHPGSCRSAIACAPSAWRSGCQVPDVTDPRRPAWRSRRSPSARRCSAG